VDLNSKSEFKTDLKFEVIPKPALSGQMLALHVPAEKLKASISSLRCQAKGRKPFLFSAGVHVNLGTAVRWEHHLSLHCPHAWPLGALPAPTYFHAVRLGRLQQGIKEWPLVQAAILLCSKGTAEEFSSL